MAGRSRPKRAKVRGTSAKAQLPKVVNGGFRLDVATTPVAAFPTGVSGAGHGLSLVPKLEECGRMDISSESDLRARPNGSWPGSVPIRCRHG